MEKLLMSNQLLVVMLMFILYGSCFGRVEEEKSRVMCKIGSPKLVKGEWTCADLENNMIYGAEGGMMKEGKFADLCNHKACNKGKDCADCCGPYYPICSCQSENACFCGCW